MESCTERGCPAGGTDACAYVDRDGHGCGTVWCESHIRLFGGEPYCRRHASTMAALSGLKTVGGERPPLPPLSNRGASLLRWMSKELDEPVRAFLSRERHFRGSITASGHTELPDGMHSRWTWRWSVQDEGAAAPHLVVSLRVEEATDAQVDVYANDQLAHSAIPPWIGHRMNREDVDDITDARERVEYSNAIISSIASVLGTQDPGAARLANS